MSIEVKIEGNKVIITADISNPPVVSKTGKSCLIVSSGGIKNTDAMFNGRPVSIGLNVMVPVKG
ncbi:MAG: hypothetical protein WCS52_02000 [bacterium]